MSASDAAPGRRLEVLHLQAGGCGGCALEFALVALAGLGLVETEHPRHADLLVVSGAPGREMMRAVRAAWTAMAEPKYLVALGDCAIEGGRFRGAYAVEGGLEGRLPVALAIPGSPPGPDAIRDALGALVRAIEAGAAVSDEPIRRTAEAETAPTPAPGASPTPVPTPAPTPAPLALLPAAPRHRLSGDGSSDS